MEHVVCSIQGSFAPPHLGHKQSGAIFARALLNLYPQANEIKILYMPTSEIGSKESFSLKTRDKEPLINQQKTDVVTETERFWSLNEYCKELNEEFKGTQIIFEVSTIEYEIQPKLKTTATYPTVLELKERYPNSKIVLAMGEDNARQLLWWGNIQDYPTLIDKLLLVNRIPEVPYLYDSGIKIATGETMKFNAGWTITLDGEKKNFSAEEILTSEKPNAQQIQLSIKNLAEKTYLLDAPGPYSSTNLRKALAEGRNENTKKIAGNALALYYKSHGIARRTLGSVKKLPIGWTIKDKRRRQRKRKTRKI